MLVRKKCSVITISLFIILISELMISCATYTGGRERWKVPDPKNTIVLYDETIIDCELDVVWFELLDYVHWAFPQATIRRIQGQDGHEGEVLMVNKTLLHEIVRIRPKRSVVWKTCKIDDCEKNYAFTNFTVDKYDKKTTLQESVFSQEGFWTIEEIQGMKAYHLLRKEPPFFQKASEDYKKYLENNIECQK